MYANCEDYLLVNHLLMTEVHVCLLVAEESSKLHNVSVHRTSFVYLHIHILLHKNSSETVWRWDFGERIAKKLPRDTGIDSIQFCSAVLSWWAMLL